MRLTTRKHELCNGVFRSWVLFFAIAISASAPPSIAIGQMQDESGEQTNIPVGEFIEYKDAEYGVIINYPQDWELVERDEGSIAVFFSPDASLPENENASVGHLALYVDRRVGVSNLSSYSDTLIAEYSDQLVGFAALDRAPRTLAGGEAEQLTFEWIDEGESFKALDVWTLRNGLVYHAVYYSPPDSFEKDLGTVSAMLDSFQILSALIDRPIVGGQYEIPQIDLKIQLPDDWAGYVIYEGNSTFAFVSPAEIQRNLGGNSNSEDFAVMIIYFDPDERFEAQREWSAYGCDAPKMASLVTVGTNPATKVFAQCTDPQINQLEVYGFASSDKGFYVGYGTSSDNAYQHYLEEFETSLISIQLLDPADPAEVTKYAKIGGMGSGAYRVSVGDNTYDLYIASTNQIASVILNEDESRIELEIEGDQRPEGEIYLRAGYFLNGPYVVTIDGTIAEVGVELLEDDDAKYLSITFDGSQAHAVIIAGASIVPEFDVVLIILTTTMVFVLAFRVTHGRRTRFFG